MDCKYKKIKVNKDWIKKNIIKRGWQRFVYPSRVNKFAGYIRDGKFHTSLITVAVNPEGKYILIDGQHKLEAIKKENIDFDMDFRIYEGLNEEEMYEKYQIENDVKGFRLVDDIKGYTELKKYDWLNAFLDDSNFPIEVTLRGGINSVKIGDILNVIYNGLRSSIVRANLTRNKLPLFLDDLDAEKFSLMKDFCTLYKKCFGNPHRDNWMYKNAVMFTFFRIWMKNKEDFKEEEFVKRWRPIERSSPIRQEATAGVFDTGILEIMTRKIYKTINKGCSKNMMQEFWIED